MAAPRSGRGFHSKVFITALSATELAALLVDEQASGLSVLLAHQPVTLSDGRTESQAMNTKALADQAALLIVADGL